MSTFSMLRSVKGKTYFINTYLVRVLVLAQGSFLNLTILNKEITKKRKNKIEKKNNQKYISFQKIPLSFPPLSKPLVKVTKNIAKIRIFMIKISNFD